MTESLRRQEAGIPGSDLGWTLGVILRRWHEQVELAVADLPNGPRGYQILSTVGHNDPPTQSGLAKHLNIDKTVMPYIIDALEKEGLVRRVTDTRDRRVRRIEITAKGVRTLSKLEAKVHEVEELLFQGLDSNQRSSFLEQAARLAGLIHSNEPNLDPCIAVMDVLVEDSLAASE